MQALYLRCMNPSTLSLVVAFTFCICKLKSSSFWHAGRDYAHHSSAIVFHTGCKCTKCIDNRNVRCPLPAEMLTVKCRHTVTTHQNMTSLSWKSSHRTIMQGEHSSLSCCALMRHWNCQHVCVCTTLLRKITL